MIPIRSGKFLIASLWSLQKCFLEDDFAWWMSKIDGCKTAWWCSPRDEPCVCRQIHMVLSCELESVMKSKVFFWTHASSVRLCTDFKSALQLRTHVILSNATKHLWRISETDALRRYWKKWPILTIKRARYGRLTRILSIVSRRQWRWIDELMFWKISEEMIELAMNQCNENDSDQGSYFDVDRRHNTFTDSRWNYII